MATMQTTKAQKLSSVPLPAKKKATAIAALDGGLSTGETINESDKSRAETDALALIEASVETGETVYTIGTPVNATGVANFRKSAIEVENLPPFVEVAERGAALIRDEARGMIETDLKSCALDITGGLLVVSDATALPYTNTALRQLVSRANTFPDGAAAYLSDCDARLRAVNFNHYAPLAQDVAVNLRTRDYHARREVFAATAKIFRPFDADRVCEIVGDKVSKMPGGTAGGELTYDGSRFTLKAFWHSQIEPEHCVAGEVFKVGLISDLADDGTRGLHFKACFWRNLCKNLIIVDLHELRTWTAHVRKDMGAWVEEQLALAASKVATFSEKWSTARLAKIIDGAGGAEEVQHVFTQIVKKGLLQVPGCKREDLVERLVTAWNLEPGYTQADIVNAVTRAAHSNTWSNPWASTDLEEQAGALLYNKLVLAPYQPEA